MSQLPTQLYPNNPLPRDSTPNSSKSNGSFGPVFAVLAVIVVISAVACVLGRLCNRRKIRGDKEASKGDHHSKKGKKHNHGLPKEWEPRQEPRMNMGDGDIEFGFGKKLPSAKNGGKPQPLHPPPNGGARRPEVRFADV